MRRRDCRKRSNKVLAEVGSCIASDQSSTALTPTQQRRRRRRQKAEEERSGNFGMKKLKARRIRFLQIKYSRA
jgi:hypothetical protein